MKQGKSQDKPLGAFKDLTGQKFNRLTVISRDKSKRTRRGTYWLCRCDCGNYTVVDRYKLISGHTKSCGCYQRERSREIHRKTIKHNMSKTRIYRVWSSMMDRCFNPNSKERRLYGGRGITVCEEWRDFRNFCKWAYETGYQEDAAYGKCTIDRIDVNGNYEPSNCRWVDLKAQSRNTRCNVVVDYQGEKHCLSEWAEIKGISYNRLHQRIKSGWTFEQAIETPVGGKPK